MTIDLSKLVRRLFWVKHPAANIWRCDTPHGTYKIFCVSGVSWDYDSATSPDECTSKIAEDLGAAKEAANADHAARVMADLDAEALAVPGVAALADFNREMARGIKMIHDALADGSRPRQSVGEVAAWWLRYTEQVADAVSAIRAGKGEDA